MDKAPNYAGYSIDELRQARASIDERRFPARKAQLDELIAAHIATARAEDPEPAAEVTDSQAPSEFKLVITTLISIPCYPILCLVVIEALYSGSITSKYHHVYTWQQQPWMYSFHLLVLCVVLICWPWGLTLMWLKRLKLPDR
ncbi:hypothetical protein JYB87_17825 [Shewanella avicenniae]|uniref:DUF1707 domain-containing protein n=1 Tax=Shewanella avicenniae TaxID=2814294 RepID=A0ABX7QPY9_9GAMM|nr:hypothetical protein [Shewanella avicenniae]QSX33541.1 hypothetical protein JYB87_17825 [Shewanella avicenniae]